MKIKEVTIKGITYTVRGETDKAVKKAIKDLRTLNKKTKDEDAI
jgi:hypothetical protein